MILIRNLKTFFLSRKTVITLLALNLCSTLVGGLVPQRMATSGVDMEKWRQAHPLFLPWAERLGLFHLFSTPWFALFLFLAVIALALSSLEQFKGAFRRTFDASATPDNPDAVVSISAEKMRIVMRRLGYFPLGRGGRLRFVRQPWGHWGNFLLHSGMVLTIAASLAVALTQQRGVVHLVEGRVHSTSDPWLAQELGLTASFLVLPCDIRLDRLNLNFSGERVGQVSSTIAFLAPREETREVGINSPLDWRDMRVYQSNDYGAAFTVEFAEPTGAVHTELLLIPFPSRPDQAGYDDFRLSWLPYVLSAKYYADADRRTLRSDNPQLVMRLLDGDRELSRLSLLRGGSGTLGRLQVRLANVETWSGLMFVKVTGMPLIFLGFCILVLGALLHYAAVPRELTAAPSSEGYRIAWRASRFADFYADEFAAIIENLEKEAIS